MTMGLIPSGRKWSILAWSAWLPALVAVPLFASQYSLALASIAFLAAIRAVSLTIIVGWTGQFAFTSVVFFAVGAYTGPLVDSLAGISLELVILLSAVAGVTVGGLLGLLVARLKRYYLTIATTAFLFIVDFTWRNLEGVTGGVRGFTVEEPVLLVLGGRVVASDAGKYYISLVLLGAIVAFCAWLLRTPLARGWWALRESEDVAASLGIDPLRSKVAAFALSSGIASVGGAWFAYLDNHVFPANFTFELQVIDVVIIVVGGLGSLRGAVLAAVLVTLVSEFVRNLVGLSEMVFGAVLLLCVLFLPRGLYGELAQRFRSLRERLL